MQFTRLRLAGFKSFVDPTEVVIEPGLTGIVGPNGCGKSNIVEALRWVMGESSAKQLRGGEMDDVIFAGTASRPGRNLAEVALSLDNAERRAPAAFNDAGDIEVVRRIERESGSAYAINGREARARDVQTLFADASSGARSTAIVSQGRIGTIIAAKPEQRRHILEEAAGISGLHARRHEAELRLRAAETNLERLDDVVGALEDQLRGLRRQARQATRYRNLSGHIRRAEALLLHLDWSAATVARETAGAELAAAETEVAESTRLAAAAARDQAEASAVLPALRGEEAEAAAALHRLEVARDALAAEEERVAAATAEARRRLEQIAADLAREGAQREDAAAQIARLEDERATLAEAQRGEEEERRQADSALAEARAAVSALEQAASAATREVAAAEARLGALQRRVQEIAQRRERLTGTVGEIERERAGARAEAKDIAALAEAQEEVAAARAAREAARAALDEAEGRHAAAQAEEAAARPDFQSAEAELARVRAEEAALRALLETGEPDLWPQIMDAMTVTAGYEVALGAALGEDLLAPADEAAPVHWRTLPVYEAPPPLAPGAMPLSELVAAPPALARRLSQIGVVEDETALDRLGPGLAQGQRLVTRDGALRRWDGFSVRAGAPTAAATRMEQRNRLARLDDERESLEAAEAEARAGLQSLTEATRAAGDAAREARERVRAADAAFQAARDAEAASAQRSAEARSRIETLGETLVRLSTELGELDEAERAAQEEIAGLADLDQRRAEAERLQARLAEGREAMTARQSAADRLARECEIRAQRGAAIEGELTRWRAAADGAARQSALLEERRDATLAELERLEARPAEIAAQRETLFAEIDAAARRRGQAADRLAAAETALAEAETLAKRREARLSEAREERIRREAAVERAEQVLAQLAERIAERLDCRPDAVLEAGGIGADEAMPARDEVESRLQRLLRERETMGPVNLRAESEAAELDQRISEMQTEREDLVAAIAKLRRGIAGLNSEGRGRLLAAFTEIDKHFQDLFARLFAGGRAHLSLTDADDPLEAGLEIMASPPGKKLQSLSLLSGGEQALTALALLFAVFLTNPAPVCVLDEVDAPLDDNNVDRFCTLLAEIAEGTSTRFLLVTHHRLTMARMDRLYGVTMAEQGVSQLVSVDLQTAERLRETA